MVLNFGLSFILNEIVDNVWHGVLKLIYLTINSLWHTKSTYLLVKNLNFGLVLAFMNELDDYVCDELLKQIFLHKRPLTRLRVE